MHELIAAKRIHEDALTVNGKTVGENARQASVADPDVIRPYDRPLKAQAGFKVLRGNLFDSAIMKVSVIAEEFRARYLSSPTDPNAFEGRAVVFDGVCSNDEMRALVLQSLAVLKASADHYIIFEEKPDAATRKQIEKYAETSEKFDAVKQKDSSSIFSLANALRRGDKKALWVGYQRELASGKAPEAIHGVLFWGAKEMFLKSGAGAAKDRAGKLIATLAELPHESRRKGIELEYAIERFVLSEV